MQTQHNTHIKPNKNVSIILQNTAHYYVVQQAQNIIKVYKRNSNTAQQLNVCTSAQPKQPSTKKAATKNWFQQVTAKQQKRLAAQAQRNAARKAKAAAKAQKTSPKMQKRNAVKKIKTPLLAPAKTKVKPTARSIAANCIVKQHSAHFIQTVTATNKARLALNLPALSAQAAVAYYNKYMHNVANAVPVTQIVLNHAKQQSVPSAQAIAA